ncbi:unnamed protein product [Rotaria magnacalcarata]|uniref:DNA-directed primase/polymerase protein n=1 Tax=Rotaria magnacalcarata TaxID=392030 RepID=A0A816MX57_9BILA|nr:unnamed protein product [Rotaria magnacalcarata]CAF1358310.1 unnamed protein product [Rotaria magnacalcarata]CAF2021362.1 unnamed protein product [Rotaria magnacalcarata]CAF3828046.1 unnamed protein product [Rotaria magnacalcarata]CAF3833975.1 unnamed protein product [Rotaria magnacalcarata]
MNAAWKNNLQEYCQKNQISLPNYRIKTQSGPAHSLKFQVEVEINGYWYPGDERCSSKKEAEQSAAKMALECLLDRNQSSQASTCISSDEISDPTSSCCDVIPLPTQIQVNLVDSKSHFPDEYADIEEFITNKVKEFNGRIRKIWPLDSRGNYKVDIGGSYRYCENIQRDHKKNGIYFIVNPIKKTYFQKCHDLQCYGFQSAIKYITKDPTTSSPHSLETNSNSNCSKCRKSLKPPSQISCERCGETFCEKCTNFCELCHDAVHCDRCFESCIECHDS